MKVCFFCPVLTSILVHMASALQVTQGSFLCKPGLHKWVGLSFISPSSINLFRDDSKIARWRAWTQHLKNPPSFLHFLANLVCSWNLNAWFFVEIWTFVRNMNLRSVHISWNTLWCLMGWLICHSKKWHWHKEIHRFSSTLFWYSL